MFEDAVAALGIDPTKLPSGTMGWMTAADYAGLTDVSEKFATILKSFAKNPDNKNVLVYEVENEHDRFVGLVLRNLHSVKARSRHLTVIFNSEKGDEFPGPFFHNLTPALELAWPSGPLVAVEGPKDARVLYQEGIPAVAYLGAAPSQEWLKSIRRYTSLLIWIPDNDGELDPKIEWRRKKVLDDAADLNIVVRTIKLRGSKDPGKLVDNPAEMARVKEIVGSVQGLF